MTNTRLTDEAVSWSTENLKNNCDERSRFVQAVLRCVRSRFRNRVPTGPRMLFDVDDLAQETAMKALEHVENAERNVKISEAFIWTIAQRLVIDQVRKCLAKKRSPSEGFVDVSSNSSTNRLNEVEAVNVPPSQKEMHHEFWAMAMKVLNPDERKMIELKYSDELTHKEIGELLGKTGPAVRSLLFRIQKKIRQELAKNRSFESYCES